MRDQKWLLQNALERLHVFNRQEELVERVSENRESILVVLKLHPKRLCIRYILLYSFKILTRHLETAGSLQLHINSIPAREISWTTPLSGDKKKKYFTVFMKPLLFKVAKSSSLLSAGSKAAVNTFSPYNVDVSSATQ